MWISIAAVALALVGIVTYRLSGHLTADRIVKTSGDTANAWWRPTMMILVSLLVLAAALWVIVKPGYDDGVKKWAFGAVGLIVGFWLKSA